LEQGIILKSTGSWYKVKSTKGDIVDCKIVGKLRMSDLRSTNPISVGDKVDFERESDLIGVINNIHERKNYLIRKSSNLSKESHIVAANIDWCYLVVTVNYPKTMLAFIDRFLVTAEAYRIPVKIIFNKIDLYNDEDFVALEEWEAIYNTIGYQTFRLSTTTGENIEQLKSQLSDTISLFSGNSGVGKSSIINKLDTSLSIKTHELSKGHKKGTHTTTFAEMYETSNGGYIVDTPGLKGFGLLRMEEQEISHYFPEMFRLLKDCSFHNCTHVHEPNCAVQRAVSNGEISFSRYENYISMLEDLKQDRYRR